MLVLGVVCSAIAFLLFFFLIAEVGPGRASVMTYVHPLVAVLLGVLFLEERVGLATLAGMGLILVGSWLATRHGARGPQNLQSGTDYKNVSKEQ